MITVLADFLLAAFGIIYVAAIAWVLIMWFMDWRNDGG